jgi:asparagine synthase (glutamine-hydrolysing)
VGGYYTLRSASSFAFTRCASFRHRPGQADLLHVDLWWRGYNVALDPGTYSYNCPGPWDNALAGTLYHNTVTVDGLDQMARAGRFLWLPWARGRTLRRLESDGGRIAYWEGGHDGYRRLPQPATHRRAIIRLGAEDWLILDQLRSRGPHLFRLHWLLPDLPHEWSDRRLAGGEGAEDATMTLETPLGPYSARFGALGSPGESSLVRADEAGPRGWRSPRYLEREPALSVALTCRSESVRFWTWFGPSRGRARIEDRQLHLAGKGWEGQITLGEGSGALSTHVRFEAGNTDSLRID